MFSTSLTTATDGQRNLKGDYIMDEFNFAQMAKDISRVHSGLQHLDVTSTEPNVNILADAYGVLRIAFNYFADMAKKVKEKEQTEPEEVTEKE